MDYFTALALGKIGIEEQKIVVEIIDNEDQTQLETAKEFVRAYKRIVLEQTKKICTLERAVLLDRNGRRLNFKTG